MTDSELREILETAKTVAVVGMSPNPERDSHRVGIYLRDHGYRVIPVNPSVERIGDMQSYASLRDIPEHVDVVDVFRRPDAVPPIAEDAIAIGAGVLWLQLGVINEQAAARARAAGLRVVMDRCAKIEHQRLIGG